jgi:nuclear pore complex protein Nup85
MHTTLSLFVVLYLPAPGHAQSMVGEPLLEWLNHSFVDPPSTEGDALSALERPWEDPGFWPYVARATLRGLSQAAQFFLGTLAGHPSTHVQKSATLLTPLIADQPRAFNFATEREFRAAHRRWHDAVRLARVELDRVPEKERDDGFENWWRWMSDVVGLLEGRAEVLSGLATEVGADWKDVLAAWTVFIRPETRRDDLPDVLENAGLEADPYDLEDQLHFSLMSGACPKALELAAQHDPWLAAHLADLMEPDVLAEEDKLLV